MDYILLCNYTPFKTGQRVRLPDRTAEKLLSEGIVRRADEPRPELRKPWRWEAKEEIVPTPIPAKETPSLLERVIMHEAEDEEPVVPPKIPSDGPIDMKDSPFVQESYTAKKKKGHGRKR